MGRQTSLRNAIKEKGILVTQTETRITDDGIYEGEWETAVWSAIRRLSCIKRAFGRNKRPLITLNGAQEESNEGEGSCKVTDGDGEGCDADTGHNNGLDRQVMIQESSRKTGYRSNSRC